MSSATHLVRSRFAITIAALATLIITPWASGGFALVERFDDGGFTDGADPLDAQWYRRLAYNPDSDRGTTLTIVDDSGLGAINGGNAMRVTTGAASDGNPDAPIFGMFGGVDLSKGHIKYDVDFRLETLPASGTTSFRYGLYQSVSPAIVGDGGTQSFSDKGYQGVFRVGTFAPSTGFSRDNGLATTAAPTYAVTGATSLFSSSSPPAAVNLNTTDAYHLTLLLEAATGGVQITLTLNGVQLFSVLDTPDANGNPITSFDYVVFSINRDPNGVNQPYILDNLVIATPEPTSAALMVLGVLAIAARRSRSQG